MDAFAIKSKRIVTPDGVKDGFVLVSNERIADVCTELPPHYKHTVVDATDKILFPGVVDTHVHINEPGRTEWEGFETATKAAIAGGVTTLVDMPLNAMPVTTTAAAFDEKAASTNNQLNADVGFWGGIVPGNEAEIEPLISKGVLGFKAFLTHSGIDDFPNVTQADLQKAMPLIARYNLPLLVHCELSQPMPPVANNTSYMQYLSSRPSKWEDDAIALMIDLCEKFNCRVHIVHLSSANALEQIAAAKARGLPLTVETAQHYLYFNAETIPDGNTTYKCAPPIRGRQNNEALWQALKDGTIDFVATDHSPAPPELKELRSGNLTKAWGGIASIQFALSALYTAGQKHQVTLSQLARWLSEAPAAMAQIASKGKIEKGYIADLVIYNDKRDFVVNETNIHHKHKVTAYLGERFTGVVEQTYLSGRKVYDTGQFLHEHSGKLLKRS